MGLIMKNGIPYGGDSGGSGNANIVKLTQAEYDALPSSKNSDGILYAITDGESSSGGTSKPVELTKAQYEALGESTKTDGILYAITDGDDLSAKNLEYDGSITGLGNNVQDAIDVLNANVNEQNKNIKIIQTTTPNVVGTNTAIYSDTSLYGNYIAIGYSILHDGVYYNWIYNDIVDAILINEYGVVMCLKHEAIKSKPIYIVLMKIN